MAKRGTPTVSVIMPVYNGEDLVTQSIASVQAQSFHDWELLVIDDASTDGTRKVVEGIAAVDPRIRFLKLARNGGPTVARNAGLRQARGRYVALLDGDDLWLPGKLERQLAAMADSTCAMCCTSYGLMDHAGHPLGKIRHVKNRVYHYNDIVANNVIGCLTVLIDTRQTGLQQIPPVHSIAEDYAFWLHLLRQGYTVQGLPENLATYRLRKGSRSSVKLKAAWAVWHIFLQNEHLPLYKALWYFAIYAIRRAPRLFERTSL